MRTKFLYFGVISLTLIALFSFSGKQETPDFSSLVYERFYSFLDNFREEKVYLQTDKPYYSAGEIIWLKGYLVNAATMKPESFSGFIYVELTNRDDSIISRVKIAKDSTGFSGYIKLDQEIPSGDYNIRAYTQWMQNNAADFFFSKNIHIGNRIEELVTYQTTYGDVLDGAVLVNIQFVDEHKISISEKNVEVAGQWLDGKKKKNKKISLTTNAEGYVSFNLPVDTLDHSPKVLDLSLNLGTYIFESRLLLPAFGNDFDVQFFPESGVLLNKGLQYLAFKAIGTDGMSREVTGKIYSNKDEELGEIKTDYNGTGKFMLFTVPGGSYYAMLKSDKGIEKRFELPKLATEGVALRLNFFRGKINYSIINQLPDQTTQLYLLIHSNGKPFVVSPINKLMGQISEAKLDAGIFSFAIVDSLGNVYCERQFFKNAESFPTITMKPDKDVYGKRELVNVSFNVQSGLNKTPEGFYSVSVTDSRFVKQDSINNNIISYLLLSSDLKGHIENPVNYFTDDSVTSHEKLDLLMLTQGWTRYNTSDLLKDKQKQGDFQMEVGQTISGKVLNLFGKPVKNCDVYGIVNGHIITTQTDSLGKYVFDGMGFRDSVSFVIRADKKKVFLDVELIPDAEIFPAPNTHFLARSMQEQSTADEYFDQSKLKFFSDGGIRHIYLDEVTVKASRKRSATSDGFMSAMADSEVTSEELDRMRGRSLFTILSTISGVMVSGRNVTIRNNPGAPLIMIDGISSMGGVEDIEFLTTDDIESIQVFKGATASFFGAGSSNGVISFTTKRGQVNTVRTPISMATVTPLGCQKPEKFYVPKYDVQSIRDGVNPDLRTTIYWNPSLSSDSSGNINVQFYTADQATDYSVVLEGVTMAGEVCRYEGVIKRN